MKLPLLMAAGACALLLAGCEGDDSPVARVEQQVTGNYPTQSHSFDGGERQVFDAARQTLKKMGYRVTKGGPAEDFFDATSGVQPSDDVDMWRQFGMHADFQPSLDGKTTTVVVSMSETDAPQGAGQAAGRVGSETPLRDTPLYEVFFHGIQDALGQPDTKAQGIAAPVGG